MQVIRVLLIEDSSTDVQLLSEAFAKEPGAQVELTVAGRLAEGLARLAKEPVDVILLDLHLPDSTGIDTLAKVHAAAGRAPVIVLTASDDDDLALRAMQHGAQDYLVKGYVRVFRRLLGRSIRYAIERQRAEEQLRTAHAQTQQLLASLPSILIGVTRDGIITQWNGVAEATFGISAQAALNRPLAAAGVRWHHEKILTALAAQGAHEPATRLDEIPYTRPDGSEGLLGITVVRLRSGPGREEGFLLCGADITERQQAEAERLRLQQQLAQAQKMETVGRFAGGIAHDFNNFLQVILGFTWLIRVRYPHDHALMRDLQEITHAAESASEMVRQLLAFSRRQPLETKPIDINQAVQGMARLLQQLVGERIRVQLQLGEGPLVARLDPTSLEQLLMNLCANARDSMQNGGGTLTIATQALVLDERFQEQHPSCTKLGECVRLSISDTGTGMDPEVASHVFEPFFTTKQMGRGAGLGLSVVYGLVKQHGGFIDVETAVGRGTTFHLYFSRDLTSVPVALPAAAADGDGAGTRREQGANRQRVLVVDDEPPILHLCRRILETAYDVTTVTSGREALAELSRAPFDLLLTDIIMPEMDGFELLRQLGARPRPALSILAMTGSLTLESEHRLVSVPLIRKPFSAPALLDAVTRCLATGGEAAPNGA